MTDAKKASRSPAPKAASGKRNATAKTSPPGRSAREQDADIKAGEAAMRDAARLGKAARPAARRTRKRATAQAKTAKMEPGAAKGATRRPEPTAARKTVPAFRPNHVATPARANVAGWMGALGQLQAAALRASTELARSQLSAAQSSASLGLRLADFTMAQARSQLGAIQTMISTAELQRRVARQAFDAAASQAKEMRSMVTELAGSSARTWMAFEKLVPSERKKAR